MGENRKTIDVKHSKKIVIIISLVLIFLLLIASKLQTISSTKAVSLANPHLSNKKIKDTSYLEQLNDYEFDIYKTIVDRIDNFNDGVIEFRYPITGVEYLRIRDCIKIYNADYAYAILCYPMDENNRKSDAVTNNDFENINEDIFQKCILLLNSSEMKLEDIEISKDGYIQNLDEFEHDSVDSKKKAEVLKLEQEGIRILDSVVKGVPNGSGQRDALEYFIKWMNENLTYYNESYSKFHETNTEEMNTTENWYNYYYVPSSLSCVVNGKALCVGYSKTLVYLCNSIGIKAKVVAGNIKVSDGSVDHAITEVQIEGKTAYFDLTGAWDYRKGTGKALSKSNVENFMELYNYFSVY